MKKIILALSLVATLFVLTACKLTDSVTKDGEKVTINDNHGTREVKTNPKKVAFMMLDSLDMLDTVWEKTGIESIALSFKSSSKALSKYNRNDVVDLGNHKVINYDELIKFQPDLVILGNRTTDLFDNEEFNKSILGADVYDSTMSISEGRMVETMEKNAENFEKIFPNIKGELINKVKDIKATIEEIKNKVDDKKAIFVMSNGTDLSVYGNDSRYAIVHHDFGFLNADETLITGGAHGTSITYEYFNKINPEIMFVLDRSAAIGENSGLSDFLNQTLVQGTTAGINKNIFELDNDSWYLVTGGINAALQIIKDIEQYTNK